MAGRGRTKLTVAERRARIREASLRYRAKHPVREHTRRITREAINAGVIKVKPCYWCGTEKHIHAHHEDYDNPLRVVFLCSPCHHRRHTQLRRWREYMENELHREANRQRVARAKAAARRTKGAAMTTNGRSAKQEGE